LDEICELHNVLVHPAHTDPPLLVLYFVCDSRVVLFLIQHQIDFCCTCQPVAWEDGAATGTCRRRPGGGEGGRAVCSSRGQQVWPHPLCLYNTSEAK